jgi:hypothetical protein
MGPDEREHRDHRAIWVSLPTEVRWALLALGMVAIDPDTGAPVLQDADAALKLAAFHGAP